MLALLALASLPLGPAPVPAPLQDVPAPPSASDLATVEWRTFETDGAALRYALLDPGPAAGPRPVLLALPPGSQDEELVRAGLELYWAREAVRLGWVVVSPAAPEGSTLDADGGRALEALAEALIAELAPEAGRLHLAGVSSGGRSAFDLALRAPDLWHTLTLAPGVPAEGSDLTPLVHLPVAFFGGADDGAWAAGMRAARDELLRLGAPHVDLQLFEGEGHVPPSLEGGAPLFHRLQEHRGRALARVVAEAAAEATLDDFHAAAAEADGQRYFAHFAPGATFLGTDATERWSVEAFRAYAEPYFERGDGWTYVPTERHLSLSPGGSVAWFDERLQNDTYGETRGSGVLVRRGDRWLLSQYVLSLPVPNELAKDVVERIRGLGK